MRSFLSRAHYLTVSLSDLPSEGSRGRRHQADDRREEPGPESWSSEGLYWRCRMFSPARVLLCLCSVSNTNMCLNYDSRTCPTMASLFSSFFTSSTLSK